MSGKIYQKNGMQRIGKHAQDTGSGGERSYLPLSVRVSERLGRKIRLVSARTRLSDRIITGEAIARGFVLLKP